MFLTQLFKMCQPHSIWALDSEHSTCPILLATWGDAASALEGCMKRSSERSSSSAAGGGGSGGESGGGGRGGGGGDGASMRLGTPCTLCVGDAAHPEVR